MKNRINHSFRSILFVISIMTFFSSCRLEKIITSPDNENRIVDTNSVIADLITDIAANDGSNDNIIDFANCFNVKLPVTVVANGIEVVINTNEDFDLIRAIFDESTLDIDMIEINFPITVVMANYSEEILRSQSELDELSNMCNGEDEADNDIECIDFLYPISFSVYNTLTEQTTEVTIENDMVLFLFIKDLNADNVASLNFPVTLILSDNSRQTVSSLAELEILVNNVKDTCDEDDDFDFFDTDFGDTQSPSTPINLVASNTTETTTDLTWEPSIDNIGVTTYGIYIDGVFRTSTPTTTITIKDLEANTLYSFEVVARDAAGNGSANSNSVAVTTLPSTDTTPPTPPLNLIASDITQTTTILTWDVATDNIGVSGYDIYRDGILLDNTAETSYNISGLVASTTYTFTVLARDAAGNSSISSNNAVITTLALTGDIEAPTAPINLMVSNITSSSTDLTWDASSDNVGVTGYEVYIDGAFLKFVTTTFTDITGLTPETGYTFTVLAKDAEGNSSILSNPVAITTLAATQALEIDDVLTTCTNWIIEKFVDDDDDETGDLNSFTFNFSSDGTVVAENTATSQVFSGTWEIKITRSGKKRLKLRIPGINNNIVDDFNTNWRVVTTVRSDGTTIIELNSEDKILIFSTTTCS